ncbi:MAG TPA: cytochrome c-type biogenesis protein CcmH [Acidimicrobiales bacterium]|nr:cytochrome c-type biogenesis protein CcmH [Acidimicrobiales bacterium]
MTARRLLPWLALALVVAGSLVVGAGGSGGPPTDAERKTALASELRCPTCRGQSVRDSDAPAAAAIRAEIDRRVDEGQSDEEILAYVDSKFPESLRLTPPASGLGVLVWALPVVALVAAVAGLAAAFRRWSAEPLPAPSDDDRALVQRARSSGP